jgi:hypothetical protein
LEPDPTFFHQMVPPGTAARPSVTGWPNAGAVSAAAPKVIALRLVN